MGNDFDKKFHDLLFPDYANTTFAVINGVAGSRTHQQWEIVAIRDDLGRPEEAVAELQGAIDAIAPQPQDFRAWAQRHELPQDQSDVHDDPDGDGSPNYLEFAYGTNPTMARFHHRPTIERSEKGVTITLREAIDVTGLEIAVDQSPDLTQWEPLPNDQTQEKINRFQSFVIRTLTLPTQDSSAMFYRIRVTVE